MVIQNSEVSMASKSSITREMKVTFQSETKPIINMADIQFMGGGITTENAKNAEKTTDDNSLINASANQQVRLNTINYLIRMLMMGGYFDENTPMGQLMKELYGEDGEGGSMGSGMSALGSTHAQPVFVQSTKLSQYYTEEQNVEYSSTGTAITADGRKLEFSYSFAFSESFTEEYHMEHLAIRNCVDPLVINLDDCPTAIADQSFFFDLDGDGEEEELKNIGSGSAFLALDHNEDGVINDGTELFGAKTGDGFRELEQYDEDGNGWIDENDSVFSRLKVMTITETGEQELYGLKDADVGAIYLGRVETDYMKRDDANNIHAAVRKSGLFLHEKDGHAGGVQHVDFVK